MDTERDVGQVTCPKGDYKGPRDSFENEAKRAGLLSGRLKCPDPSRGYEFGHSVPGWVTGIFKLGNKR